MITAKIIFSGKENIVFKLYCLTREVIPDTEDPAPLYERINGVYDMTVTLVYEACHGDMTTLSCYEKTVRETTA